MGLQPINTTPVCLSPCFIPPGIFAVAVMTLAASTTKKICHVGPSYAYITCTCACVYVKLRSSHRKLICRQMIYQEVINRFCWKYPPAHTHTCTVYIPLTNIWKKLSAHAFLYILCITDDHMSPYYIFTYMYLFIYMYGMVAKVHVVTHWDLYQRLTGLDPGLSPC